MSAQWLGEWALLPFLRDTIQFWPLTCTMASMLASQPVAMACVLSQVS